MSTLTIPVRAVKPSAVPQPKRWTVDEFYALWNQGWFEGCKPMLLDGEILEMAFPNPQHDTSLTLVLYALMTVFGAGYVVRPQMPLPMGQMWDPLPDLAVVRGCLRDYAMAHPRTAILIVEVSESTLSIDTGRKANLYASGGIADYWVVDLDNRRLIVFRDPVADPSVYLGFRYNTRIELDPTASISPLAVPQTSFTVGDWLP